MEYLVVKCHPNLIQAISGIIILWLKFVWPFCVVYAVQKLQTFISSFTLVYFFYSLAEANPERFNKRYRNKLQYGVVRKCVCLCERVGESVCA